MIKPPVGTILELNGNHVSERPRRAQTVTYFTLAVLGFSFWFFMAVPFASHRESYWWLASVHTQQFAKAFSFISVTYRPLAQATAWLGFMILNPRLFPTSVLRQSLLQGFIYGMFVLGWWLIYSTTVQRRLFALVAFVTGGVFFSGYVHLFHIYGIFYVPVVLTLGLSLRIHASSARDRRELWLAAAGMVLVFWHPFATALFGGFYFGFYLDTFWQRSKMQHIQAVAILLAVTIAIAALVVILPRADVMASPLHTKLFGFLESYRTTEVNRVASVVAFLLSLLVVFSMRLSPKLNLTAFLLVSTLGCVFLMKSVPLMLLWLCTVLIKLVRSHCWSLFFLALVAALLPFGAGIGGPVAALFAVIVAAYVTPLGWSRAEEALRAVTTRHVAGAVILLATVILMVRLGIDVPIVTRAASPLLTERERTYQLESILAWMHHSDYCACELAFIENAGSPIDSVENAITRRNRPPAALEDVELFWDSVLQCQWSERPYSKAGTAVVTFGGPRLIDSRAVFKVEGRYGGDATVWIRNSRK